MKIIYKVVDTHGVIITGNFIGSYEEFIEFIKKNKYFLISYSEKNGLKNKKFTNKDYMYFLEECSYLISSGMSIDNAIKNLISNSSTNIQKKYYEYILENLKSGELLSEAILKASKKINFDVDKLSILLINTNESVGNIVKGLKVAYEHILFKDKIFNEIKQALSYPIFLIVMSILLIFFVFIFIVPRFTTIFTPTEFQNLPILSKIILETGIFVNNNLKFILVFLLILIISSIIYYKKILKFLLDNFFIRIKKFKNLIINLQLSYFFGALNLMLEGGIDIKRALKESSKIITFKPLKILIHKSYQQLLKGEKLSSSLKGSELIDNNTISLISAGENSSNLIEVFDSLSKRYMFVFKKDIKQLLNLLEPLIIILMGGIIAIIVIAIMLAIMSINNIAG